MRKSYIIAFLIACVSVFNALNAQAQEGNGNAMVCGETVLDVDNISYPIVTFAGHCWMSKNLAATSGVTSGNVYAYQSSQFPDEAGNVTAYGRLYDETAAMQSLCPEGWSLPTTTLLDYVKSHYAAEDLRNSTGWINGGGNSTGFSWDASGMRNGTTGRFENMLTEGYLWAVDTSDGAHQPAMYKMMYYCNEIVRVQNFGGISASVRCVKDGGELPENPEPQPEPQPQPQPQPQPEPEIFTCGTSKMIDSSGNKYETVQIGELCWTKTNLRTTKFRNGGAIPENQDASLGTASLYRPAVAEHFTDSIYGMYYNWYAVEGDTLCPAGWHVPTQAEWDQLTTYMSSQNGYWCGNNAHYIAWALAGTHHYINQSEETVYAWQNEDKSCAVGTDRGYNNASGFSAFPAGYWETTFQGYRQSANFWTSTPEDNKAWSYHLYFSEEMLSSHTEYKKTAFSVRCVKDN